MNKFEYVHLSFQVSYDYHLLTISIPEKFRFVSDFIQSNFHSSIAIDNLFIELKNIPESRSVHYGWNAIDSLDNEYEGDLRMDLSKYLSSNEKGIIIEKNDFIIKKAEVDNNIKLLRFITKYFPDYGENKLSYSDDVYGLSICDKKCILVKNINPVEYIEFPTIALLNLIAEIKDFYNDYNNLKINGLSPRIVEA